MANSIYIAPDSAVALDHLQERLKSSQASFEIQPRVFYEDFKNIVLYVQDAIPTKGQALWRGIFLADISDPSSPKITLAQRGALLSDGPNKLRFHLEDGTQQETVPKVKDQYSITTFDNTEIPLVLPSDESKPHDLLPVAELNLHDLLANAKRERAAAQTYYPWDMGSYNYDLIKARYYEIEFHRRFALPTACLVLAMVGIPLGLSARKGGKSTGFVLTILLVVVYYFFSLLGVQMARQGKLSPWFGSWMGNIFFFLCGLFLLWRVDRMPLEIGNLTAGWKTLMQKLQAIGTRRREAAAAASYTVLVASPPLQRALSADPRRHDPARLRAVPHHDHVDLPGARAGLYLLRAADRHCAQQGAADHRGRVSVESKPVDDLPDGAYGRAAGGAHHLWPAG